MDHGSATSSKYNSFVLFLRKCQYNTYKMRKTIRSLIRQRPRSIQSKSFFNKSSLLFQHHNISTKTSIPWQQALRRNHQLLKKNNTKTRTFTTATKPVRNNSSSRVSRNTMDSLEDQLPQLETALQRVMKLQNEDRTLIFFCFLCSSFFLGFAFLFG